MRENFELNEYILQQEIHIDEQAREIKRLKSETAAAEKFEEKASGIEPPAIDFGDPGSVPAFPRPGDPGPGADEQVPPPPFNPGGGQQNPPGDAALDFVLPGLEGRPGTPDEAISHIESISLDPRLTRAYNLDAAPGDDGLVVVVEPRDDSDRPTPAIGKLSIVAVDPSLPEHLARVARWDYSTDEVRELFVQTRQGPRIVCQLLWPDVKPKSTRLQLYVRMETSDGEQHQAEMPLLADFAGSDLVGQRFASRNEISGETFENRMAARTAEQATRRTAEDQYANDLGSSEHGRSLDSYLNGSGTSADPARSEAQPERNATTERSATPPGERRPLRRVTAPGEEPPARQQADPVRTTRRGLPPWSPIR